MTRREAVVLAGVATAFLATAGLAADPTTPAYDPAHGEPFDDGTWWDDGTGWVD